MHLSKDQHKFKTLMIVTSILTVVVFLLSINAGYIKIPLNEVFATLIGQGTPKNELTIFDFRLPRIIMALLVGMGIAVSGAILQGVSQNPLADPGILGINSGAGFAVVFAMIFFHISSLQSFAWIAFLGAAIAALSVYGISFSGRDAVTPVKITLAGAAISALFASFTQGLLATNEAELDQVLFWLAGSVQGRKLEILLSVLPYLVIGWIAALIISPKMNILALGDDVARGLGLRLGLMKILVGLIVIFLAGGAVAIAGPIGFIGIVVPHFARKFVGTDHRWLIPMAALLGEVGS